MSLPPGSVVEHCTIAETLGVGGFGITYKAWDNREERAVALKENFPSWLVQRGADGNVCLTGDAKDFAWTLRHFIDEARILARLRHPHIVRVYRAFESHGTAFFVMEYLDAVGLNKCCGASRWTEETLRLLLTRLLRALKYIHEQGVYHRDIKPANIMLRRSDNSPVLIDFGAAKSGPSRYTYTCGFVSMGYTSPEQLADSSTLSPGMDIYSLGATLYCVLTGNPPPNASARLLRDEMIPLHTRRDLLARFSRELLATIDKALALDPARRHASADHWLLELHHPAAGRQKHPAPSSAPSAIPTVGTVHTRSASPAPRPGEEQNFNGYKLFLASFWGGSLLLLLIGLSLLGSPSQSHNLDALFPIALMLTLIGLAGLLYYRSRQDG